MKKRRRATTTTTTSTQQKKKVSLSKPVVIDSGGSYVGERLSEALESKHNDFEIVTFNVSGFDPSDKAETGFEAVHNMMWFCTLIRNALPTAFCLQELPTSRTCAYSRVVYETVSGLCSDLANPKLRYKYKEVLAEVRSHCGFVKIFVRSDIKVLKSVVVGPCVIAKIDMSHEKNKRYVYLASAHLAPHKEYASKRNEQMKQVVDWIEQDQESEPDAETCWILAGDMNMRGAETASMKKVSSRGSKLSDAWEAAGKPHESRFTWDSKRNKYHQNCFEFTCRFDRIFTFPQIKPRRFHLVGDEPYPDRDDQYVSDHFGIFASFPKTDMFPSFKINEHMTEEERRVRASSSVRATQSDETSLKSKPDVTLIKPDGDVTLMSMKEMETLMSEKEIEELI